MGIRQAETDRDQLVFEADLPAPPGRAFDFLVQPDLLARWWPPEAQVDPRPGGEYVFSWSSQGWNLRGEYTDFEPGERLAFTWQWDHEPDLPARHVTITLDPRGEGSLLRLTQGVYGPRAIEQDDRESHRQGWLHFLARLAEELAPDG